MRTSRFLPMRSLQAPFCGFEFRNVEPRRTSVRVTKGNCRSTQKEQTMRFTRCFALAVGTAALAGAGLTATTPALALPHAHPTFIGNLHHTKLVASTVPSNGDVNPYGVALVRRSQGLLHKGSVLISNFNNSKNLQGTGSTIVEISPSGHRTQFAAISKHGLPGACPGGIGLTTALVIINNWVFVGSTPSTNGQAATAKAGCVLVLDSTGHVRETISGHNVNGTWNATA